MKIFALLFVLLSAGFVSAQTAAAKPNTSTVTVEVTGAKPITISSAEFAKYPRKEVRGKDHDGKESVYSGVELREILKPLGVKFGAEMRGKQLAQYLLVEAADGYRVVFAIAELDPEFTDDAVILADTQDGKPLSEKDGKFQIIVPADKRQGRWVRQVTKLAVVTALNNSVSGNYSIIEEDIIRYVVYDEMFSTRFKENKEGNNRPVVFLAVDGNRDPNVSLIERFQDRNFIARKNSEDITLKSDGTFRESKEQSVVARLSLINWQSAYTVIVTAGIDCGNLCGTQCTYILRKTNGLWKIEAKNNCSIS